MGKNRRKFFIIACITIVVVFAVFFSVKAITSSYSYGQPGIFDAVLNPDGSVLFVSYPEDQAVVAIDTESMEELTRYQVNSPGPMCISPDGEYLYSLCISYAFENELVRIRLSDGVISPLGFDYNFENMVIDPDGERLWVVGGVWPAYGDPVDADDWKDHPGTGRLTEVDLTNFTVSQTVSIEAQPISVWYSTYSDKLYILYDGYVSICQGEWENEADWVVGRRMYVYDASTFTYVDDFIGGGCSFFLGIPQQLTGWDDEGRYLAIPGTVGSPPSSIRVIDTTDDIVAFDIIIPSGGANTTFRFAHKQPDSNYFWAGTLRGYPDNSCEEGSVPLVRINTVTHEYDTFCIDGMEWNFGDFAISPDGDTFYIPEIETGNLFVWSPPK